ncbi:MAG: glycosyltransferase [Chloroflexi bacterium]|nr:MAG: glycosyltransferase [Chloroflexota bacterium]
MKPKPRILLYSHDTYGLGHLRRSLAIARRLAQDIPNVYQLLITGSMVAGAFSLPPRLDIIKLPALSKRSNGQYKARALPLSLKRTISWREQIILQAVQNFKPDIVLVDKVADGVYGELLPSLRYIKTWLPDTLLLLGMRDIEDSPAATQLEWHTRGTYQLLDSVYDRILYYGQRNVFDPVYAYEMSVNAAVKLVPCGYIRYEQEIRPSEAVRRELGIGYKPLILVTVGGGGDGFEILKNYLEMLSTHSQNTNFHSLLVTGPLMSHQKRYQLQNLCPPEGVTLMEFTPDLLSYMNAADLVISMAGYNTVCEILSLKKRAILIPRMHTRAEQKIRAEQLAKRKMVQMILPDALTPHLLWETISRNLLLPPPEQTLDINGLAHVSYAIAELLTNPELVLHGRPTRELDTSLTMLLQKKGMMI